jgi:hypothetical protein
MYNCGHRMDFSEEASQIINKGSYIRDCDW